MTAREVVSEVHAAGEWPHKVCVARKARLNENLDHIVWRYMAGIKVYNGNQVALDLNVEQAEGLMYALEDAIAQAKAGPLGDIEVPS